MLRTLFAKQEDPYAGADLGLTQRLGGAFWLVNCLLAIALWPLSRIVRQSGDLGWLLGVALVFPAMIFA
ncbi:MAG: hypothetical protein ACRDKV_05755, partial [Solirubrobacterales bacterium]